MIKQRGPGIRRLEWLFSVVDSSGGLAESLFTWSMVGWMWVVEGLICWFRVDQ